MPSCPRCQTSIAVRPASPLAREIPLRVVRLVAFRCDACGSRFTRFAPRTTSQQAAPYETLPQANAPPTASPVREPTRPLPATHAMVQPTARPDHAMPQLRPDPPTPGTGPPDPEPIVFDFRLAGPRPGPRAGPDFSLQPGPHAAFAEAAALSPHPAPTFDFRRLEPNARDPEYLRQQAVLDANRKRLARNTPERRRQRALIRSRLVTFAAFHLAEMTLTVFLLLAFGFTRGWQILLPLLPPLGAFPAWLHLKRSHIAAADSAAETRRLMLWWLALGLGLDLLLNALLIPWLHHEPPNLAIFARSSPWIWWSYLVTLSCGWIARPLYRAPSPAPGIADPPHAAD